MALATGVIPVDVVEYLRLHHVITLGTSSFTGMPHADTVIYANDEQHVYFFAMPKSSLARNIADNHYVSFTIDDYTTDWRKVRELQGVGRGQPADPDDPWPLSLAVAKFGERFSPPQGTLHRL